MADIIYLIIGVVAGLVAGSILVFLLPYQTLRHSRRRDQMELAEAQAKNNELQSAMLEEQSKAYQARQALLMQQKRLENELAEAGRRQAEMERQSADLSAQSDQRRHAQIDEIAQLHDTITRLEQEQEALQDRFAQENTEWERERQSLLLQNAQLDDQLGALRRDKMALDNRLEQQHEAWERERLALQIQMNTLEDNLTLQKARTGHGLQTMLPDNAQLLEQLRAEATMELNRRQAAWDEERQTMQERMERLQAERQALRDQVTANSDTAKESSRESRLEEIEALRQLLVQARREQRNLEEKLVARDRQAEQERGALEGEIEQLMDRLLRLHREHGSG